MVFAAVFEGVGGLDGGAGLLGVGVGEASWSRSNCEGGVVAEGREAGRTVSRWCCHGRDWVRWDDLERDMKRCHPLNTSRETATELTEVLPDANVPGLELRKSMLLLRDCGRRKSHSWQQGQS